MIALRESALKLRSPRLLLKNIYNKKRRKLFNMNHLRALELVSICLQGEGVSLIKYLATLKKN